MEAEDVLYIVLSIFTGFVLLVVPCLIGVPAARWISRQLENLLGLADFRRRTHDPATERVLEFLGFTLYSCREYGDGTQPAQDLATGAILDPGSGIGLVRLGMSPAHVVATIGQPSGYDAWDDGNLNDFLIYDGVRLYFDRCDWRGPLRRSQLVTIEVRRPDAILFNRRLVSWGEAELLTELVQRGFLLRIRESGYAEFTSPYLRAWFESG